MGSPVTQPNIIQDIFCAQVPPRHCSPTYLLSLAFSITVASDVRGRLLVSDLKLVGVARDPCCVLRNKKKMCSNKNYLSEKELEEVIRRYEAGDEDSDYDNIDLSDSGSEFEDHEEEENIEEDEIVYLPPENDDEIQSSDDEIPLADLQKKIIYGKNGYRWHSRPFYSKNTRTLRKNLILHLPGPKGAARNTKSEYEAWQLFFDETILQEIITHTNEEIVRNQKQFSKVQRYTDQIDKIELEALFGLLYTSGALKYNHVNLEELWSKKYGPPIFRATMSKNRFSFLIKNLRFDDKATRNQRKESDKFCAIRDIWDKYVENCRNNYTPSEYLTVDEQLLGFRGRCPFRMYIPNKPDKYGIKIVMMCDAKTFYMVSAIPYVGKESRPSNLPIPTQYVLELSKPIQKTNRNITVDNWFSSMGLAASLKEVGLTLVGTLRKNKPEIPTEFLKPKTLEPNRFAFDGDVVLVSHTPNKSRVVMLMSTMHNDNEVDENSGKSEINLFYNATKGGVDVFDQLCHNKSVSRRTKRWPLRVLYGMLDGGAVNSYVIFKANGTNTKNMPRRKFLLQLGEELTKAHMKRRLQIKNLPHILR